MGFLYWFDWTYLVFVIPCLIITIIAQARVKSTFSKYTNVRNLNGLTGLQVAQRVLAVNGITDVRVEKVAGNLTDHYDPKEKVIRLSESVCDVATVAAVGVAAHEAGHAVQHAVNYAPVKIRQSIFPLANIGSRLSWFLILIGMFLPVQYEAVLYAGIILYSLAVLFTIVTLPVEFDASKRALECIEKNGILSSTENEGAKKVLSAAAMTYVAAALTSIMQLLRLILIANRRR